MIRRVMLRGLLSALLMGAPSLARAQDETKPKPAPVRPRVQKPAPVEVKAAPKPEAAYLALPPPLAPGGAFTSAGFGLKGLSAGGLQSNLPVITDAGAVCRASCAKSRYVCLAIDDAVVCDPAWSQCLSACGD